MKVNKRNLMIRLCNRISNERDYWKAKCSALIDGEPFTENERWERRADKQRIIKKV